MIDNQELYLTSARLELQLDRGNAVDDRVRSQFADDRRPVVDQAGFQTQMRQRFPGQGPGLASG
jgi:hypothetical protein